MLNRKSERSSAGINNLTRALATLVLVVMSAGCNNLTEFNGETSRYGAIDIRGASTSATTVNASATAIFFEAVNAVVPNSSTQQNDACVYAVVDTTTLEVRGQSRVGDSLSLSVGGNQVPFPYQDANLRYATSATQPFSYQSGDVAQISIPGSGELFPPSNISVKLAEPIVPGALTLPAVGQSLALSWNATNDPTSAMLISVRYANPSNTSYANEQIYCSVKDDGIFEIPGTGLSALLASPAARRSVRFTRYRTNEVQIDSRTLLHVATTVDTVVTFQ